MKYIDLFAGVGGFRYGIEKATDWKCVYSNEWDKYANSVYRKHYGECDQRDITTVPTSDITDHDLLCGGFPCQSFSVAGKRHGFNDTRGTMFFEIARIAKDKRPRYLLLENVKGLLSHDKGQTFQTILGVLSDLGYRIEWQVLNSKHFGVPQNRERVFIVGHRGGFGRRKVFPVGRTGTKDNGRVGLETAYCLDSNYWKGTNTTKKGRRQLVRTDKQDTQQKGNKPDSSNSISRESYTDGMRIRRLTPVECERLQGFPDNWTQYGADGELISDTQRYKMMGNAVTTNVITAIAERLAR